MNSCWTENPMAAPFLFLVDAICPRGQYADLRLTHPTWSCSSGLWSVGTSCFLLFSPQISKLSTYSFLLLHLFITHTDRHTHTPTHTHTHTLRKVKGRLEKTEGQKKKKWEETSHETFNCLDKKELKRIRIPVPLTHYLFLQILALK